MGYEIFSAVKNIIFSRYIYLYIVIWIQKIIWWGGRGEKMPPVCIYFFVLVAVKLQLTYVDQGGFSKLYYPGQVTSVSSLAKLCTELELDPSLLSFEQREHLN